MQDKIEKLNIIIDRYTQKIDEIKNHLADINKQYANMISDLFKNKIKLSTTQLNLVISPKIQQLIGETKLPASIELDANFNLLLISKLCKEFAADNAKINQTEEILIKIAEETLKSKIEALPELAQLDKATRDLVINKFPSTWFGWSCSRAGRGSVRTRIG